MLCYKQEISRMMLIEFAQEMAMQEEAVNALYREAIEAEQRNDMVRAYRIYEQIVVTAAGNLTAQARNSIQELRPCLISLFLKNAEEAHGQGAWQEEIDIWRQLLAFRPLQREVDGQGVLLRESLLRQSMQTICASLQEDHRYLPGNVDEMIAERIRIAEQNMQHSDMYTNAQEEVSNHNLRAAKELLLQLWVEAPYYGDPAGLARTAGMKYRALNYEQAIKRRTILEMLLLVLNYTVFISGSAYFSLSVFQNALLKISITLSTSASVVASLYLLLLFIIGISVITAAFIFVFLILVMTSSIAAVAVTEVETIELQAGAIRGSAKRTALLVLLLMVEIIILLLLLTSISKETMVVIITLLLISIVTLIYGMHQFERISQLMEWLKPAIFIGVHLFVVVGMILLILELRSVSWTNTIQKEFLSAIKTAPYSSHLLTPGPGDFLLGIPFSLLLLFCFVSEPVEVVIKPKRMAMRLTNFGLMLIEKQPLAKLSTGLKKKAILRLIDIKRDLLIEKLPTRWSSLLCLSMPSTMIFAFCVSGLVPQTYLFLPLIMMLLLVFNFFV